MNHPALSGWPKGRHCRNPLWKRILSAPADSKAVFRYAGNISGIQKNARRFSAGWVSLRSRGTKKRKNTMANGKPGRPKEVDPKIHRYNFKLTSEQNTRFRQMSKRPDAPATYLISSSPGSSDENSASLKSDPSAARYVARLNDFYWQFSRIGEQLQSNCQTGQYALFRKDNPRPTLDAGKLYTPTQSPQRANRFPEQRTA